MMWSLRACCSASNSSVLMMHEQPESIIVNISKEHDSSFFISYPPVRAYVFSEHYTPARSFHGQVYRSDKFLEFGIDFFVAPAFKLAKDKFKFGIDPFPVVGSHVVCGLLTVDLNDLIFIGFTDLVAEG